MHQKSVFSVAIVGMIKQWVALCCILPCIWVMKAVQNAFAFVSSLVSNDEDHTTKVHSVLHFLKQWRLDGAVCHISSFALPYRLRNKSLASIYERLDGTISVNIDEKYIVVEPMAKIGDINDLLLDNGHGLPVRPQSDALTVLQLMCGVGLDSGSHLHGFFKDTCLGFEFCTLDGQIMHCSEMENQEIFYALPCSASTLGIVLAFKLKIIPVKKYVKLQYIPTDGISETCKELASSCSNPCFDFVEAIVFSEDKAVVIKGNFEEETTNNCTPIRVSHWWKPWFYQHVDAITRSGPTSEYVPIQDYYRRHSRSFFWLIRDTNPLVGSLFFRYLFGWLLPVFSLKVLDIQNEDDRIIQDMIVPAQCLNKILTYVFRNIKVFPLWLCPVKCYNIPGLIHPGIGMDELYVNIGTYGRVGLDDFHPVECIRAYEIIVRRVTGFQMPYAESYQSREEFSQMYDRSLYDSLRRKMPYCLSAFPDIYDAFRSARWQLNT